MIVSGYRVTASGVEITDQIEALSWEENTQEIAARVMFSVGLDPYRQTSLHELVQLGSPIELFAQARDGSGLRQFRSVFVGRVHEWVFEDDARRSVTVTAYDNLINMVRSKDDVRFRTHTKAQAAIRVMVGKYGIPIDEARFEVPDLSLGQVYFRGQSVASMLLNILGQVRFFSGASGVDAVVGVYFVRSFDGKLQIIRPGGNEELTFDALNASGIQDRHDLNDTVTRVRLIGMEQEVQGYSIETPARIIDQRDATDKDGVSLVEKFGLLQEILYEDDFSGSRAWAESAIRQVISQRGSPRRIMRIRAPDYAFVRKGDAHIFRLGTLNGRHIVTGVQHNWQTGEMTMEIDTSGFLGRSVPLITPRNPEADIAEPYPSKPPNAENPNS